MNDQERTIRQILGYARRIAVVGLSPSSHRTSHRVAAGLQARGYEIVPVNPYAEVVLGEQAYPSLQDVPGKIDLVDVFRRSEYLEDVARDAADVGARSLWLQLGLISDEARRIANTTGMDFVEDSCLEVEVNHLSRELALPPQIGKRL